MNRNKDEDLFLCPVTAVDISWGFEVTTDVQPSLSGKKVKTPYTQYDNTIPRHTLN